MKPGTISSGHMHPPSMAKAMPIGGPIEQNHYVVTGLWLQLGECEAARVAHDRLDRLQPGLERAPLRVTHVLCYDQIHPVEIYPRRSG